MTSDVHGPRPATNLPQWSAVLAVVAHPDDESFGLGAVIDAFARAGTVVSVLCLTQGEASTVSGVAGDLATVRAAELQAAARLLGVGSAELRHHPDGGLSAVPPETLAREVLEALDASEAQGLVVFDPSGVTGHSDHSAATVAGLVAARIRGLPVLGWTIPRAVAGKLNEEYGASFVGHEPDQIDLVLTVDRDGQRAASLVHASQAVPTSVLWRRLELLGAQEHLRRLS